MKNRNIVFSVKLSDEELSQVRLKAALSGLKPSTYMRQVALASNALDNKKPAA